MDELVTCVLLNGLIRDVYTDEFAMCTTPGVSCLPHAGCSKEREFFIDNLLVRIHFITVMIRWTGLAPWEFEFPFPGSLTSTFLA